MPLTRFPCTFALLFASLIATSTAIEFSGENDVTQTAGTVAPADELQAGNFENSDQWAQTASSSNNVPMVTPGGIGSQQWSQPTATETPSVWTQSSGFGSINQGWPLTGGQSSKTGEQSWTPSSGGPSDAGWSPSVMDVSLECSGSDDDLFTGSLECSGSDEEEPSAHLTSTAGSSNANPTTTTAPTTSSGIDQGWSKPSLDTAASAASDEDQATGSATTSSIMSDTTTSSRIGNEEDSTQTSRMSSTTSSSNTPASGFRQNDESSTTAQTSTNTTSKSKHATFGTITSKSGECVIGDPNTYITPKDLKWIWDNRMEEVTTYNNWILDHIVHNKGSINYCVRWDSDKKLTKEIAAKLQPMLTRQHAAWNHWLIGYNCWPYDEIKVNVVGVAVKDASLLGFTDDTLGKIYAGDLDKDGSPQCPENCYRSMDGSPGGWSESSGCKGEPFDISLWPKQGLGGGWGTYWGQQVNLDDMLEHLDDKELEIVSHEMGHGFGLPDFYQEPKPDNFKPCLMDALTSSSVRDTDGWMLRRVLENKKKNYNF